MKTKTFLIAAVMLLAFSVAAYAQIGATYTVGSSPKTQVIETGYTELAGNVSFTTVPYTAQTITSTITIDYGVPVTYAGTVITDVPVGETGNAPTITSEIDSNSQLTLKITPATSG